jgi:hypothetical protein
MIEMLGAALFADSIGRRRDAISWQALKQVASQ